MAHNFTYNAVQWYSGRKRAVRLLQYAMHCKYRVTGDDTDQ